MNRVIKFRAWGRYGDWDENEDKRQWQMVDGDSLCFEEFAPLCDLLEDKEDQEYFMQFTGLKDKNGVDIYEGDILKTDSGANQTVKYREDMAAFVCSFDKGASTNIDHNWEIIGNIYESQSKKLNSHE